MQIKTFKINIGGFNFSKKEEKEHLATFIGMIKDVKKYLKVLHIHTANLKNVELNDFRHLL